jgi:hypothetical protein
MNYRKILIMYSIVCVVTILHNLMHEALHYFLALWMGMGVLEFRFLTNGMLTSQVIYDQPVDLRSGPSWLLIGLGPAVLTTLAGYAVYLLRDRLVTGLPLLNLGIWYLGALFMVIDPLYLGLLSWLISGTDVEAMKAVGLPAWPVRLVFLAVAAFGVWLVVRWREEARRRLERYAIT